MAVDGQRPKLQREPRRQMGGRPAWFTVDDGMTRRACQVLDVSPGGARILDRPGDRRQGQVQAGAGAGASEAPALRSGLASRQDLRPEVHFLIAVERPFGRSSTQNTPSSLRRQIEACHLRIDGRALRPQFLAHRGSGVADLVDGFLQLLASRRSGAWSSSAPRAVRAC